MLLCYITDRCSFAGGDARQRAALLGKIAEAAEAGVDLIQLREKDLTPRALEELAREAVRAVREHSGTTKLLVNTRSDVALACGADGVQLPAGELPASEVRALWMRATTDPVDHRRVRAHGRRGSLVRQRKGQTSRSSRRFSKRYRGMSPALVLRRCARLALVRGLLDKSRGCASLRFSGPRARRRDPGRTLATVCLREPRGLPAYVSSRGATSQTRSDCCEKCDRSRLLFNAPDD